MTKKQHEHIWLTGQTALISDPDGNLWFILRWVAYPKDDDNADSCHDRFVLEPAKDT